jgi:hypothetical protein
MPQESKIRWGWLKAMYIYTIVAAGAFGLGIVVAPEVMQSIFGWPSQDPITFGVTGSVYISFALLSVLGLRSPLKIAPVLVLQLGYKVIWFIGVIVPLLISGQFPMYAILFVAIFASFIIGDLIAIPFAYVFGKEPSQEAPADLYREHEQAQSHMPSSG